MNNDVTCENACRVLANNYFLLIIEMQQKNESAAADQRYIITGYLLGG